MNDTSLQDRIDDATFDFATGEAESARRKLTALVERHPESFEAWHALTEIHYSEKNFRAALEAAEKARSLRSDDIHINTSLSRIWMRLGDKEKAERFGAQARVAGWKDVLKSPPEKDATESH